jgi:hypothetical protein
MKDFALRYKLLLTIILINACFVVGAIGYRLGAGIDFVLGGLAIACTYLSYIAAKNAKRLLLLMVNLSLAVGGGSIASILLYHHFVSSDATTLYVGGILDLGLLAFTAVHSIPFILRKKYKPTQDIQETRETWPPCFQE